MDYFTLFGLPVHYHIDRQVLISRFQDLQRRYHPDRFVNGTEAEKLTAISYSATINLAWQTLSNPLNRAKYLLSLHGFDPTNKQNILHDAIFLMEQLELREELDELEGTKDYKKLKSFINRVKNISDLCHQQMVEDLNDKRWDMAIEGVQKLLFFDRLRSSAEQVEEKLLDF